MQYLNFLINEDVVRSEINENENRTLSEFQNSFSTDMIYRDINRSINRFICEGDLVATYEAIKDYSKCYTVDYLNAKAKELAK